MGHSRFSSEEVCRRGQELYEQRIRAKVETEDNIGKMVCIDIETGDYELDEVGITASSRLHAKRPDAAVYGARIGYDVVYSFDGVLSGTALLLGNNLNVDFVDNGRLAVTPVTVP